MTVAEALATMTDEDKAKAFDHWWAKIQSESKSLTPETEVCMDSYWYPVDAIAHAIAYREPNFAPWTPEVGDSYWNVHWTGEVFGYVWSNTVWENEAINFGSVFRTPEEAEAHAARLRVFNRVCQMRKVLGLNDMSPRDIMEQLFDASDDLRPIYNQLAKEAAL